MEISVLIEKAQAGDASARKILIEENLGLVHHIVKRFAGRGYEAEDLFQTGTIGLMKAIDHFDLSYDVKFSTYAVPLIAGEIRRFLRDDGPVKVSRSLKDANYKLRQEAARIQTQEGRDPTLRELCEKTGIAYEDAVMAVAAAGEVESLSKPVYEGDGKEIALMDQLAARSADNTWEDAEPAGRPDAVKTAYRRASRTGKNPDPAALLRGSDAGPDRPKTRYQPGAG